LTTIRLSTQKIAQEAWGLFQSTMNRTGNFSKQDPPGRVIIEPELVIRKSARTISKW
jgi:DNA-binding LacI/PurR family transcriptional regulator